MNENIKCCKCGVEIPSNTPIGQCPKCLFALGIAEGEESVSARAPRCFAGYDLLRQIGCGGMGVVYEARQPRLNRTVALKMILGGVNCSAVIRRRFFIEAEAVARLDHPNIVPIYEVGEFEDQPFLSMKLIQGESLRNKMVRGELGLPKDGESLGKSALAEGERLIARLIATLARAVHHAHAHNVVHRDLKPGNILFDAKCTPHVTDFGLAKILDPAQSGPSAQTEMMGTLAYMSPQQIRADTVTPATDIYSLGVLLYELLAGQPPFHGATPNETIRLIETQPPPRLRNRNKRIHMDLETICLKCLEKEAGNRYATAEMLAEDLERWLANQPIKARPAGPFLQMARWVKRNPQGTALIAILALAFGAAIWVILDKNAQRRRMEEFTSRNCTEKARLIWANPNQTSVDIPAEDLASLLLQPWPDATGAKRLILAVNITESPVQHAKAFGPLLVKLQNRMSTVLRQPVLLDLRMCKVSHQAFMEIAQGTSDFQRLGAVSYLSAKNLNPKVEAIVQEDKGKEAVILVRSDSSITKLSDFDGRSFAFGDTNSTICVLAKKFLLQEGIRGTNLSFYTNIVDDIGMAFDIRAVSDGSRDETNSPLLVSGLTAAIRVRIGSRFVPDDFTDGSNLVQRLGRGSDPVCQFLWSQFPPKTQQMLTSAAAKPEKLQFALADGLNDVLRGKSIFDRRRFAKVPLSEEARRLLGQNSQGEDLIRLNRVLLQDAYPLEIQKRPQIDGAALQKLWFDRIAWKGLRAIHSFTITPNVYVARQDLDPAVVQAFQKAMLSISNDDLLGKLPIRPPIHGFHRPNNREFEDLLSVLTHDVIEFEGPRSSPPSAVREDRLPAPLRTEQPGN